MTNQEEKNMSRSGTNEVDFGSALGIYRKLNISKALDKRLYLQE